MMQRPIFTMLTTLAAALPAALPAQQVLVEAESFDSAGGWTLDTQFIHIMGSPYLLAHGLGEPVDDARTTVAFPTPGNYRVFVRTKDWVAPWKAPGAPGRFEVQIDGRPLPVVFGTEGADWHWQDGGTTEISKATALVTVHDLTGFEGRIDAILFAKDPAFVPPNDSKPLAEWRRQLLGLPAKPVEEGPFDFVVTGGGYAGMCAALSAARNGCKVALIQDRPVLGGNGSSEIRVWPQGLTRRGLYPCLGEIVEELADKPRSSPASAVDFNDARREQIIRAETNITLYLRHHVIAVETNDGRIAAVRALDAKTSTERRFAARYFADCTGHAYVGAMAGAKLTIKETGHMGMSNMWLWKTNAEPAEFPSVPWALDLEMGDFPYPKNGRGEWFWETGFDRDPINDLEYMRDWNFRAIYGAFNAMKNKEGAAQHQNARLEWIAAIGGTRESRQLLGDLVLTLDDLKAKTIYPDACVPTTWDVDLHYPKAEFAKKSGIEPFISYAQFGKHVDKKEGYPVPYRCFFSKNIPNLFMAGRCISVTHEALGTVRVMKTGGMMGEVVGKAAAICVRHSCTPRDVYTSHLDELKALMGQHGAMRRHAVDGAFYLPEGAVIPPPPKPDTEAARVIKYFDPKKLPGLVIDDEQAKLSGTWNSGVGLENFIGFGYRYTGKGAKGSARFEFKVPADGRYEVRFAYQQHTNRTAAAKVSVFSAEGEKVLTVNERIAAPVAPTFVSLGTFDFEAANPGVVVVDGSAADGMVAIDAIQLLPAAKP